MRNLVNLTFSNNRYHCDNNINCTLQTNNTESRSNITESRSKITETSLTKKKLWKENNPKTPPRILKLRLWFPLCKLFREIKPKETIIWFNYIFRCFGFFHHLCFVEIFSNHFKGFRKSLWPVLQTFSMIFKILSKTAHKPLI